MLPLTCEMYRHKKSRLHKHEPKYCQKSAVALVGASACSCAHVLILCVTYFALIYSH